MLNCSTCHKRKAESHFYANPSHRAHIPLTASPEDGAALARLIADGLISDAPARQINVAGHATIARARATLATSGRPPETEAQRIRREQAQARAVEREEEAARQAEIEAQIDKWALRGVGVGALAFVGALAWKAWDTWRGGASA